MSTQLAEERNAVKKFGKLLGAACVGLALTGASATAAAAGDAAAGKEKSAVCQACHGTDGNGTQPIYPRLAGQYATYIIRALEDYKTGARKNAIMAGFAAPLSAQDRADLAAFYASQKGLSVVDLYELEK